MKNNIGEMITIRILNLIKIKSILTLSFLGLTSLAIFKALELPEWLIPIISLYFKELLDKDKVKKEGVDK